MPRPERPLPTPHLVTSGVAAPSISAPYVPTASTVRVVERRADDLLVTALSGPASPWKVRCALPPGSAAATGDEVVVLDTLQGSVAVALLQRVKGPDADVAKAPANASDAASPAPAHGADTTMSLADGTVAEVDVERSRIDVRRADGTPIFQYEASAHHGCITVAHEGMRVASTAGDLQLQAAGDIRMEARSVQAHALMQGARRASLVLGPRETTLQAPTVRIAGEALQLDNNRTSLRSQEVRSEIGRAVLNVERLETVADVVVTRARNVYQQVKALLQQRSGSLRTMVDGTATLHARDVAHRAENAYKIRSEKIHLG